MSQRCTGNRVRISCRQILLESRNMSIAICIWRRSKIDFRTRIFLLSYVQYDYIALQQAR